MSLFPSPACPRPFVAALLLALVAACVEQPSTPSRVEVVSQPSSLGTRPNVVVFLVDDLDLRMFDRLIDERNPDGGSKNLPMIDSLLVQHGTRFQESFVSDSLCCPSRATFLTGQYPHNSGVRSNQLPNGTSHALDDTNTLATWLRDSGYHTAMVGKYLNGYYSRWDRDPEGWSEWKGLFGGADQYGFGYRDITPLSDGGVIMEVVDKLPGDMGDGGVNQTQWIQARALGVVDRAQQSGKPLFLWVTPGAPHIEIPKDAQGNNLPELSWEHQWSARVRPVLEHAGTLRKNNDPNGTEGRAGLEFPVPPSFNTPIVDPPSWFSTLYLGPIGSTGRRDPVPAMTESDILAIRRQYYDRMESMLAVDTLVGAVVNRLQEKGMLDNTLLVFTSDNGFLHGEHRLGEKTQAYEEAIRVPLVVSAGPTTPRRNSSSMVLNQDLTATIVDYAGLATDGGTPGVGRVLDGKSLRQLLEGTTPGTWRRRFIVEHFYNPKPVFRLDDLPTYVALRTSKQDSSASNQLYAEYYANEGGVRDVEHYDLSDSALADPYQLHNLANNKSLPLVQMRERMKKWIPLLRDCRGSTCWAYETAVDPVRLSNDMCSVVHSSAVRPVVNAQGKVVGLRQVIYAGNFNGSFWVRNTTDLSGQTWTGGWSTPTPYSSWTLSDGGTAYPPTDRVDVTVMQPLFRQDGTVERTRQMFYSGNGLWQRQSLIEDTYGSVWPDNWSPRHMLNDAWASSAGAVRPPTDGIEAAEVRALVATDGGITGMRELIYAKANVYQRDTSSLDGGSGWGSWTAAPYTRWESHVDAPPTDRLDSVNVYPVYDANGRITRFRQDFYGGTSVFRRESYDVQGVSWPTAWTKVPLSQYWGSGSSVPPSTCP